MTHQLTSKQFFGAFSVFTHKINEIKNIYNKLAIAHRSSWRRFAFHPKGFFSSKLTSGEFQVFVVSKYLELPTSIAFTETAWPYSAGDHSTVEILHCHASSVNQATNMYVYIFITITSKYVWAHTRYFYQMRWTLSIANVMAIWPTVVEKLLWTKAGSRH